MSAFNIKPSSGWIHSDKLIAKQGATYAVRVRLKKSNALENLHNKTLFYISFYL